ncbi:MAG: hypothetical protein RL038_618 [Actinomycetota bacterium]|jgi:hypothetical protein
MEYLLAFGLIFLINLLPAFAPPTWTILVFLALNFDYQPYVLIMVGLFAAASGRWLLALGSRRISGRFSESYQANLHALGERISRNQGHAIATLLLFFFSPLSSAQLFIAAGLMPNLKLGRLILAFIAGRAISYSTYVLGAAKFSETDIGSEITQNLTSPWFIVLQLALLVGVTFLGRIDWKKSEPETSS